MLATSIKTEHGGIRGEDAAVRGQHSPHAAPCEVRHIRWDHLGHRAVEDDVEVMPETVGLERRAEHQARAPVGEAVQGNLISGERREAS